MADHEQGYGTKSSTRGVDGGPQGLLTVGGDTGGIRENAFLRSCKATTVIAATFAA